jgi:hypothetical protein
LPVMSTSSLIEAGARRAGPGTRCPILRHDRRRGEFPAYASITGRVLTHSGRFPFSDRRSRIVVAMDD